MSDDYKSMGVHFGINPMGLSAPWYAYLYIIALNPVKNARDEPNGP